MKKALRIFIISILIILITVSITACSAPKDEDIIGRWEIYDTIISFFPDGTHSRATTSGRTLQQGPLKGTGTWSISGNTIKTYTDRFGFIDYVYENDTLINGDETFTRRK